MGQSLEKIAHFLTRLLIPYILKLMAAINNLSISFSVVKGRESPSFSFASSVKNAVEICDLEILS